LIILGFDFKAFIPFYMKKPFLAFNFSKFQKLLNTKNGLNAAIAKLNPKQLHFRYYGTNIE